MFAILPFVEHLHGSTALPISVFAVFDGHGGQKVAQYASQRLPQLFLRKYENTCDVERALEWAFIQTDKEISAGNAEPSVSLPELQEFQRTTSCGVFGSKALKRGDSVGKSDHLSQSHSMHEHQPTYAHFMEAPAPMAPRSRRDNDSPREPFKRRKSKDEDSLSAVPVTLTRACGTTATVVSLVGDQFTVAHVGDSRAVLSNLDGTVQRLFEDHKPGRRDEMERIESAGGLVVEVSGTFRVNGVLAVSRAIGDPELKQFIIPRPDIFKFSLSGHEEFLVLASDGLWDNISDEECMEYVRKIIYSEPADDSLEEEAAKLLVQTAWDRGTNDDISVIVVNLLKYASLWEKKQEEGDAAVEEEILGVNTENISSTCVDENQNPIELEMVTPIAALPLETPRVRKPSPW